MAKNTGLIKTYAYDPLDRLTEAHTGQKKHEQFFYNRERLITEKEGAVSRSLMHVQNQLLAQLKVEDQSCDTTLLSTNRQCSVLHSVSFSNLHSQAFAPFGHHHIQERMNGLPGFNGERSDPLTGQEQDKSRDGQRRADPLSEALGRAGSEFRFAHERGQDLDGEQCCRGDSGAKGQAQHKACRDDAHEPGQLPHDGDQGHHHDDASGDPCGVLIDRVREGKNPLQQTLLRRRDEFVRDCSAAREVAHDSA